MRIYKELSFFGDEAALDNFKELAPSFVSEGWKYSESDRMSDYIAFDYVGTKVDQAEVSIYYGKEAWRRGIICVGNIVPLVKDHDDWRVQCSS